MVNGTLLGGLATVLLVVFVAVQLTQSMVYIYNYREFEFSTIKTVLSDDDLSSTEYRLSDFDHSLNFAFGVGDPNFNNQNNPYVEFIAYTTEYTSGSEILKKELDLHECS